MSVGTDLADGSGAAGVGGHRRSRAVNRLRLHQLDHHLERAWRRGRAERDARVLAAIRSRLDAAPLVTATATGVGIIVTDLTFLDGFAVRLAPCHGPAVAALAGAIATGRPVTLRRASRHDRFWELDFTAGGAGPRPARFAVLAGVASVIGGGAPADAVARPPAVRTS